MTCLLGWGHGRGGDAWGSETGRCILVSLKKVYCLLTMALFGSLLVCCWLNICRYLSIRDENATLLCISWTGNH